MLHDRSGTDKSGFKERWWLEKSVCPGKRTFSRQIPALSRRFIVKIQDNKALRFHSVSNLSQTSDTNPLEVPIGNN